ncbi:MAG: hypothetical protein ACT4O0_19010 [Pseudonocardia sp.]
MHLVVDAANVVGSRPDGWWRDRAGAAARLVDGLAAALRAGALDGPVTVVLEGAARSGVSPGPALVAGLTVAHAARDGDSAIVTLVDALLAGASAADTAGGDTAGGVAAGGVAAGGNTAGGVAVVSADRALGERARAAGATTLSPSWLLGRLRGLSDR